MRAEQQLGGPIRSDAVRAESDDARQTRFRIIAVPNLMARTLDSVEELQLRNVVRTIG